MPLNHLCDFRAINVNLKTTKFQNTISHFIGRLICILERRLFPVFSPSTIRIKENKFGRPEGNCSSFMYIGQVLLLNNLGLV
ncbi:unnamed protein product [Lactuca virosa]|uniref:Uncharacterized protein n=1 Tax=Lactuca virosa TaxID=75947 RepID=A0AAU9N0B3_9ASTR|nr:unnamed protein product [Lactuca virosa]